MPVDENACRAYAGWCRKRCTWAPYFSFLRPAGRRRRRGLHGHLSQQGQEVPTEGPWHRWSTEAHFMSICTAGPVLSRAVQHQPQRNIEEQRISIARLRCMGTSVILDCSTCGDGSRCWRDDEGRTQQYARQVEVWEYMATRVLQSTSSRLHNHPHRVLLSQLANLTR